jgi:hypothetical protein
MGLLAGISFAVITLRAGVPDAVPGWEPGTTGQHLH